MKDEQIKLLAEAIRLLGKAISSETQKDKNFWIGNALEELSDLISNT